MSGWNADLSLPSTSLPEHRLLCAVIVTAMRDACALPIASKRGKGITMSYHAVTAHDFLWLSGLENYLHYLDIEPHYFRKALLKTMANDTAAKIGEFTPENRRIFRINKKQWDAIYDGRSPVMPEWRDYD